MKLRLLCPFIVLAGLSPLCLAEWKFFAMDTDSGTQDYMYHCPKLCGRRNTSGPLRTTMTLDKLAAREMTVWQGMQLSQQHSATMAFESIGRTRFLSDPNAGFTVRIHETVNIENIEQGITIPSAKIHIRTPPPSQKLTPCRLRRGF